MNIIEYWFFCAVIIIVVSVIAGFLVHWLTKDFDITPYKKKDE